MHGQLDRPLGSGQLGRGTLAGRDIAWLCALLVHGSCVVQRLQVHVATVEPIHVCAAVVGTGRVATRAQRQSRWIGPREPRKSLASTGLI